jgi:hypothetical protein
MATAQPSRHFFETLSDFRAAEGSYPNADTHVTPASLNGCRFGVSESVLFSQGPRHFRFAVDLKFAIQTKSDGITAYILPDITDHRSSAGKTPY